MFHRNRDNYPLMVKPHKWASYQSSGEIAEGVVGVEGGKITTDRLTALDDWTGKASTAAQITHPECSGENYASGFCSKYSRVNSNGQGLTAGKWWLPSLGELMMIYANMCKINYVLSLIEGATRLAETWHWSSTEHSVSAAWVLSLNDGTAYTSTKATGQGRVRPVSAFLI